MIEVKRSLKRIMGGNDPFQSIFYGNPGQEEFRQATADYQRMDSTKKDELIARCFKKLNKQKSSNQITNIIYLIDRVSERSDKQRLQRIACFLNALQQPKMKSAEKNSKTEMAETYFAKFYYKFLKQALCRDHSVNIKTAQASLLSKIQVAELAICMILSLIQSEFIVSFLIANKKEGEIVIDIARRIVRKAVQELKFLIQFVNSNKRLILSKNQHSIGVNQVYQKVIKINKLRNKICILAKKINIDPLQVPQYKLNPKQNCQIERQMLKRQNQKYAYKSERQIMSKKNIIDNQDDLDENDILIDQGELL